METSRQQQRLLTYLIAGAKVTGSTIGPYRSRNDLRIIVPNGATWVANQRHLDAPTHRIVSGHRTKDVMPLRDLLRRLQPILGEHGEVTDPRTLR